jgi:negative regulator of genetic competence, sporulation and motility
MDDDEHQDEDQDGDHDDDQESHHDEDEEDEDDDQESHHDEDEEDEDDDQDRRTRYVFPEFAELARLLARNDGLLFKALLNTKLRSLAAYYLSRAATDAFPGLYWQLIEAESIDERDDLITAAYGKLCRMVQDPVTLAATPLDCA